MKLWRFSVPGRGSFLSTKMLLLVNFLIVYRAANPCFGRTLAYFLLTFLFVDKRNGRDYIYLNTKEVSLSFYSNSFTMNLRQRKLFLPLPVLQVISKHSSYGFFCWNLKMFEPTGNHTLWNLELFLAWIFHFLWNAKSKPTITLRGCRALTWGCQEIYDDKISAATIIGWEFIE